MSFLFTLCDGFSLGKKVTHLVMEVTMAMTMNLKVWRWDDFYSIIPLSYMQNHDVPGKSPEYRTMRFFAVSIFFSGHKTCKLLTHTRSKYFYCLSSMCTGPSKKSGLTLPAWRQVDYSKPSISCLATGHWILLLFHSSTEAMTEKSP